MKRLSLSPVITADVEGDRNFFARKARARSFNGLMDPVIGIDHFELASEIHENPDTELSVIRYVFDVSAGYRISDGDDLTIEPGSLLWTPIGYNGGHIGSPANVGTEVEGLKILLKSATSDKIAQPSQLYIGNAQMPQLVTDGVRVKVICGSTSQMVNLVKTPDALTILHIFIEAGKSFTHDLPADWSGTILVIEGRCDIMVPEETVELDEGNVFCFGHSEIGEPVTFFGITKSEVILISGKPLNQQTFSKSAMMAGSQDAPVETISGFGVAKMEDISTETASASSFLQSRRTSHLMN